MAKKCCPTCGASMVEYRHSFSQALAEGLERLYGVGSTNLKNLELSRNQWDNFQKLRYWGLVAKATDDDGKRIGGTWRITSFGRDFVEGIATISKTVITYRGDAVGFTGPQVKFTDAEDGYKTQPDYVEDSTPHLI